MNPWNCCKWKDDLDFRPRRSGLRLRIDSDVPSVIREHCIHFAAWLRKKYEFPVRIPVYVKFKTLVRASDGELVSGLFFEPYSRSVEPYAKVAVGVVDKLEDEYNTKNAICKILCSIAHELTHYFQWINCMEPMEPRANSRIEWQASYYGHKLSKMYSMKYIWTPVEQTILKMESYDALHADDYQMLQSWTETENSSVKRMIVALVAQREADEARKLLLQLSNDSNASVRAFALDVLCGFPAPECIKRLQQAVHDERNTYARYCAIRSCADLMIDEAEDAHAVQTFFETVMHKETEPLCRLGCSYALYISGQDSALDAILSLLDSKDEDLQCETVIVLQDIAETKNIQAIAKSVKRLQKGNCSNSLSECIRLFFQNVKPIFDKCR